MAQDFKLGGGRFRRVIRQGSLIKVSQTEPRKHSGGGKRKAQHGHTRRSAQKLYELLLTCLPAKYVLWLTYPYIQGPGKVERNARAFLERLEKHHGFRVSALIKMETQQRLSPELAILLWYDAKRDLDAHAVEMLWHKTIKGEGRVKMEVPRDWERLASYISKQVAVTDSIIVVGAERHGIIEPSPSDFIKRAHNHSKKKPPDNADCLGQTAWFLCVKREWIAYTGRFHWRYHRAGIPRYRKVVRFVMDEKVDPLREKVNKTRTTYFVGEKDHFVLRGTDAVKAAKMLGIPLNAKPPSSPIQ